MRHPKCPYCPTVRSFELERRPSGDGWRRELQCPRCGEIIRSDDKGQTRLDELPLRPDLYPVLQGAATELDGIEQGQA